MDAFDVAVTLQVTRWFEPDDATSVRGAQAHPGRYRVLARTDSRRPDLLARVRAALLRPQVVGLRVFDLETNTDLLRAGHDLWRVLADLHRPVCVYAPGHSNLLGDIAAGHPSLRLVVDHAGVPLSPESHVRRWDDWAGVLALSAVPNVQVKASALPEACDEEFPYTQAQQRLRGWSTPSVPTGSCGAPTSRRSGGSAATTSTCSSRGSPRRCCHGRPRTRSSPPPRHARSASTGWGADRGPFPARRPVAFCARLMTAAGTPPDDAAIIARHCVDALLLGEENHGMELGTQYIPLIRQGLLKPGAPMTVVKETPTTLVVDGNFNFGHVVSHRVMTMRIDKAREHQVAAASIRYQTHVGRLIDYTSMASETGMIALMMCDGAWGPKFMAPVGGTERRLGINPWSMTLPNDTGGPVGFDMTSGAVALMKVQRARDLGEPMPDGWILDRDGRPTTNPADFFDGGSMLPVGGGQAHKGYALTFMIEALADVLSGMEYVADQSRDWPVIDGCFMAVFNVEAFRPLADFTRDLDGMIDWVTGSPAAAGSPGVFYQ